MDGLVIMPWKRTLQSLCTSSIRAELGSGLRLHPFARIRDHQQTELAVLAEGALCIMEQEVSEDELEQTA